MNMLIKVLTAALLAAQLALTVRELLPEDKHEEEGRQPQ